MGETGNIFRRMVPFLDDAGLFAARHWRKGLAVGAVGGVGGYGAYRYRSSGRNGLRGRSSGSSPQGMAAAQQVASRGTAYNARHPFDTVSY